MAHKPILIVEDHQAIRSALQDFFEGEGYPVMLARHGQEALELLTKPSAPKPGLILIDCRMPVMDGPTLLLEIERQHPEIFATVPTFLMSAGTDIIQLAPKFSGYIEKPFNLDDLSRIATLHCQ